MQHFDLGEKETIQLFEFCLFAIVVVFFYIDTYEKAHSHYLKAKRGEKLETDDETMKRKRK